MSVTLPEAPPAPAPTYRTVQTLLDELEVLAKGDVNMIAGLFESEDILATPCNAGFCAVAIYLQRHSGIDDINVGTECATRWMPAEEADWRWMLPPTVCEFVIRFDGGYYPELVWPEHRERYAEGIDVDAA